MKKILLLLMVLSFENIFAGNESGGGKGVQCGEKVETLDLYEAREIHGLKINDEHETVKASLREYLFLEAKYFTEKDLSLFPEPLQELIKDKIYGVVESGIIDKFVDESAENLPLPFTWDATLPALPKGCKFVQIAIYDDETDIIRRDPILWEKLSVQDQSTLISHEAFYKFRRNSGVTNSDSTRSFIARLKSNKLGEDLWSGIRGKRKLDCGGDRKVAQRSEESWMLEPVHKTSFVIVIETREGQEGVALYFKRINEYVVVGQKSVFIPNVDFFSLLESVGERFEFTINLKTLPTERDRLTTLSLTPKYSQLSGRGDEELYGFEVSFGEENTEWVNCRIRP